MHIEKSFEKQNSQQMSLSFAYFSYRAIFLSLGASFYLIAELLNIKLNKKLPTHFEPFAVMKLSILHEQKKQADVSVVPGATIHWRKA